MDLGRIGIALVAMVVTVGLVAGIVTGFFGSVGRTVLYATGLWSTNGPSTLPSLSAGAGSPMSASPTSTGSTTPTPTGLPKPVLLAAGDGGGELGTRVAARIRGVKVSDAAGKMSATVVEVGTGRVVYAHAAGTPLIPASTMKLLTSGAALSILGPEHTFTTTAVLSWTGSNPVLTVVGGGDPYLAKSDDAAYPKRASIGDLAAATARGLAKAKVKTVQLRYDTSRFTGPAWNPQWPRLYSDQVTPIWALWLDEGRVTGGSPGARVADPPRDAATVFASALKKRGIRVVSVSAGRAPVNSTQVGAVSSMPLEQIVEHLLQTSDNDAAEVLLRQLAIGAGRQGTSTDGVTTLRARLTALGVWAAGARVNDGSGLSRVTVVPASMMTKMLRLAAADEHPELRALITGLPVAGVEGSLRIRYVDDQSLAGRGVVRAKTGTLSKVHTLAGVLRTADGTLLAFAFLINEPKNEYNSVVWLDRVTTAISRCGCK